MLVARFLGSLFSDDGNDECVEEDSTSGSRSAVALRPLPPFLSGAVVLANGSSGMR